MGPETINTGITHLETCFNTIIAKIQKRAASINQNLTITDLNIGYFSQE